MCDFCVVECVVCDVCVVRFCECGCGGVCDVKFWYLRFGVRGRRVVRVDDDDAEW